MGDSEEAVKLVYTETAEVDNLNTHLVADLESGQLRLVPKKSATKRVLTSEVWKDFMLLEKGTVMSYDL